MKRKLLGGYGRTVFQGMMVGSTMIIPGVSGGSMAIILGVYDQIIHGIGSFKKDKRGNSIFFSVFGLGCLLGILLLAKPLEYLLQHHPVALMYFFMGAVAGGVPTIVSKTGAEHFSWRYLLYISIGAGFVLLLTALPIAGLLEGSTGIAAVFGMILAGLVSAVALLLPGISGSYMLLMLGLYHDTIRAILNFEIGFLLPLGLGMGIGIISAARLLEKAMKKYPGVTYLIILGFILGSLVEIFPGIPTGMDLFICPLVFAIGAGGIYWMGKQGAGG